MKRPYFFEIFAVANLALFALFAHASAAIAGSPLRHIAVFVISLCVQAAAGIAVRSVVALLRRDRSYFRTIGSAAWITDTLRMIVFGATVFATYGWIKLTVPVYHRTLFDEALWDLDRALFLGAAPTTFLLELFGARWFLQLIDWSYAYIFMISAIVAYAYFLSDPRREVRVGFANGNAVLWLAGAWLYLLVPSVGPAYRFPDVWFAHSEVLRHTQTLQALLMRNYQNVLRAAGGMPVTRPVNIVFGIGAFPSLHVAFQMYVFLWMRRLWTSGEVLFGIFVFLIFIGSMITGWHYLVDGLAGLVMAYLCYRFCFPTHADDADAVDAGRGAGAAHR